MENYKKNYFKYISLFIFFNYVLPVHHKLYVNSISKSGTYLIVPCIEQILKKKPINIESDLNKFENEQELLNWIKTNYRPTFNWNQNWIYWHSKFSPKTLTFLKSNKFIGVFIYRDPRDRLISAAHWVIKHRELSLGLGYKSNEELDLSDVIKKMIPINQSDYNDYMPWQRENIFCSIKFEDLIGPQGGGSLFKQYNAIKKLCNHLKVTLSYNELKKCANSLFGSGATFRKGQIGSWKKIFTEEHKQLFKKVSGQLLIQLGYEKDLNW